MGTKEQQEVTKRNNALRKHMTDQDLESQVSKIKIYRSTKKQGKDENFFAPSTS